MERFAAIIKCGKILRMPGGGIPTESRARELFVFVKEESVGRVVLVSSSLGEPPEGFSFEPAPKVQAELPPDLAREVGDALLCA